MHIRTVLQNSHLRDGMAFLRDCVFMTCMAFRIKNKDFHNLDGLISSFKAFFFCLIVSSSRALNGPTPKPIIMFLAYRKITDEELWRSDSI